MNAKAMRPRDEKEAEVIGKHALYDRESESKMTKETEDNRERLITFCLENGLKLTNTLFEKETREKVTYRPIGVGKGQDHRENPRPNRLHDEQRKGQDQNLRL